MGNCNNNLELKMEKFKLYTSNNARQKKVALSCIILVCCVVFTGGMNATINTLFIVGSLIIALLAPKKYGFSLYAGTVVYFGYSYIEFENYNYISDSFGVYMYINVLCMAILLNCFIHNKYSGKKICLKRSSVVITFFVFLAYYTITNLSISFLSALGVCVQISMAWLLIDEFKNQSNASLVFTYALLFSLASTLIYVFLWRDFFAVDLLSGFPGARDSNNFAYLCNLSYVLVGVNKKIRENEKVFIKLALSIGVLITVSMSGLFTLMMIFIGFKLSHKKNRREVISIVLLLGVTLVAILYSNTILTQLNRVDGFVGDISKRIIKISNEAKKGDFKSATTNRTMLWEYYMDSFENMPIQEKIFGSQTKFRLIQREYYASHNTYIDFLMGSGALGLGLFIIAFMTNIYSNFKKKNVMCIYISLIFAVNIFFRTLSGFSLIFPLFIGGVDEV